MCRDCCEAGGSNAYVVPQTVARNSQRGAAGAGRGAAPPRLTSTRLRPRRLALYSALSASADIIRASVSRSVATPDQRERVIGSQAGQQDASLPQRPTASSGPMPKARRLDRARMTRAPTACPQVSLTALKRSMSIIANATGPSTVRATCARRLAKWPWFRMPVRPARRRLSCPRRGTCGGFGAALWSANKRLSRTTRVRHFISASNLSRLQAVG